MYVYTTCMRCLCVCVCVGTAISRTRLGRSSRRRAAGCGDDDGGCSVHALERARKRWDEREWWGRGGAVNSIYKCISVCTAIRRPVCSSWCDDVCVCVCKRSTGNFNLHRVPTADAVLTRRTTFEPHARCWGLEERLFTELVAVVLTTTLMLLTTDIGCALQRRRKFPLPDDWSIFFLYYFPVS